ncbi:PRD domain-containing protein [Listeria monocytogenes]|uniref:PRD domain-containing protein n=1 Tax=Listeria monocytogenes TaxID=1639 RepID=UPI00085C4CC4|nr:PRD domain-containing protein [Listeria monocytogenes]EAD1455600.1 PRD domain-containing protein [Listeria monocytogenes]EAG9488691.1 PRD domain-containing protein [Listeria monocytogenes]EBB5867673.1 PRD domain-containing protein [Listeria monocytogenes]EIO5737312.1 PRD domain-containing protein [Listeria monocytogenes]OET94252.1 transcriptional antiterminator [Listeria monocytogenes]
MLRVKRVFNNNTILVHDSNGLEKIVIGKGISFNKRVGNIIPEEAVEKTFIVDSPEITERFVQLIKEVPINHLDLTNKIIKDAELELNVTFDELTYLGLADHINYAISRYKSGHQIKNALLLEIKKFYPKEFNAAKNSVKTISYYENVKLLEDEAGFIALHFVNGQQEGIINNTLITTEVLKKVLLILEDTLSIKLDEESLNYLRFITHLRFFIERINSEGAREKEEPEMIEQVFKLYPKAYASVQIISDYIQETLNCTVYAEELMYLTLHVQRLIK